MDNTDKPKRILVIPGIGDIHWVALKLQAFIKHVGFNKPEIHIWNFDGRPRSMDFVRRLPFVTPGEYFNEPITIAKREFMALYKYPGIDWVDNFLGFDYFLCVNGSLEHGRTMEEILPGLATNWDYPITRTPKELEFQKFAANRYDKYALLYFSEFGMFKEWLKVWPYCSIRHFVLALKEYFPDTRFILTGSDWDKSGNIGNALKDITLNILGETSLCELFGLIRGAQMFVGWCGGNTIMSSHFKTPTAMIWHDYFPNRKFQTAWSRPGNQFYLPMNIEDYGPEDAAKLIHDWYTSANF